MPEINRGTTENHDFVLPNRRRAKFTLRVAGVVCGVAQLLLGALGFFGIYAWLTASNENPERYQLMFVPLFAFFWSIPLLAVSAIAYRICKSEMVVVEKWIINVGCTLPIFAAAIAALLGIL